MNKVKSRQHLILLLALDHTSPTSAINYLATQIESFLFFVNTLGIQTKSYEHLFSQWTVSLRGLKSEVEIRSVVDATLRPYIEGRMIEFRTRFMTLRDTAYHPLYRLRYVLGRMENTLLDQCNTPQKGLRFIDGLQIEHILPQTPQNGVIPLSLGATRIEYDDYVHSLGNVTLLESTINQAVSKYNNLSGAWFCGKQSEYVKSSLLSTKLIDKNFCVGVNTSVNKLKPSYGFDFSDWDVSAIQKRQALMLELAMDTWLINGRRIDQ